MTTLNLAPSVGFLRAKTALSEAAARHKAAEMALKSAMDFASDRECRDLNERAQFAYDDTVAASDALAETPDQQYLNAMELAEAECRPGRQPDFRPDGFPNF